MNETDQCKRVAAWLADRSSLLLLAHERPDGDAYGSLFGLLLALQAAGKDCAAYLGGALARRYRTVLPHADSVFVATRAPRSSFDGVVCLDVTAWSRVEAPPGCDPKKLGASVCVIDHHPDNTRFGDVSWVDPGKAAAAQMVSEALREMGAQVPPSAATCLLVGLVMDTGGFRFANTDAAVLRESARLIDAGADYAGVMDGLFMREPYNRRLLEAKLMQGARFACGRRLIYVVLDPAMLRELSVPADDTEGLIDAMKTVDGVDITCLIYVEDDGVRFSFRSRTPACPVSEMARALGGGGHVLAAGASVPGLTVPDAERRLLELARGMLADG